MDIALEVRITGHASYINMEKVLEVLNEIDSSNISARELQMLARISSTFDFLKETLDRVDPWLVSTTTLNNINSPISQVLGEITNYKNNRNEGHLVNVLSYLENLIIYFSQFVVTKTPEEIEGIKSSVTKFRHSVGQHIANIEKDATEASTALTKNTEKLNELSASIDNQKTRIDSIVSEFQSQFLQAQTQKSQEFNNFIIKGEADFKGTIESFGDSFEQQIETQQQSFDSLIEKLKTKVQTELDQINAMNKEAEKILGLMSMKGLAQGYQKIANSEGKKAIIWNVISLLSLLGILWFGYKFLILHTGTMTWTALVSRIVLTGVGLTLFTYGAKQATNHNNEERRNRKIELELASLDPYLKDLEPTKQKEVKQALVDKYFGVDLPGVFPQQIQQKNIADEISNNPQLLQTLVTKVFELVSKKFTN